MSDTTIFFCRDGHLRAKNNFEVAEIKEIESAGKKVPLINMKTIQSFLGYGDLVFWKGFWNNPIVFEEGLTLREFLINLEPWVSFFEDYIPQQVRISEYIKEVKKTHLRTIGGQQEELCDYIVINQITTASPLISRNEQNYKNNYTPITEFHGKYSFQFQISISGIFNDDREEVTNIEHTPLNHLAHKKIYLNRNHYVIFDKIIDTVTKHNGIPSSVFNHNAYGVYNLNDYQDVMVSEREITFQDLINNFFKHFFPTIQERNIQMENIHNFLYNEDFETLSSTFDNKELDDTLEILVSQKIIEDDIAENVSSFCESTYQINDLNKNVETKHSDLPVQPNAFSNLDLKVHIKKSLADAKKEESKKAIAKQKDLEINKQ